MKQEDLFQAMSGIEESLLQETESRRARGKSGEDKYGYYAVWRYWCWQAQERRLLF